MVYIPAGDSIEVWQADGSATDYPGSSYGEVLINGNHEWRAPVGGGSVNWNACDENPLNVRLTTMDPGYNDVDTAASSRLSEKEFSDADYQDLADKRRFFDNLS